MSYFIILKALSDKYSLSLHDALPILSDFLFSHIVIISGRKPCSRMVLFPRISDGGFIGKALTTAPFQVDTDSGCIQERVTANLFIHGKCPDVGEIIITSEPDVSIDTQADIVVSLRINTRGGHGTGK